MGYILASFFWDVGRAFSSLFSDLLLPFRVFRKNFWLSFAKVLLNAAKHLEKKYEANNEASVAPYVSEKVTSVVCTDILAQKASIASAIKTQEGIATEKSNSGQVIQHHIIPTARCKGDLKDKFEPSKALQVFAYHSKEIEVRYHQMFDACVPQEALARVFVELGFTLNECHIFFEMCAIVERNFGAKTKDINGKYFVFGPNERKTFWKLLNGKSNGYILDFLFDSAWKAGKLTLAEKSKIQEAKSFLNRGKQSKAA